MDRVFSDPAGLRELSPSELSREDYYARICAGGFPEPLAMPARLRRGWFSSYVTTLTQRDIRELARVRQASELPRLLRLLAGMTAQELVKARLAEQSRMDAQAVANYLPLLATVFLIRQLPAWSRNLTAKVKRHPKVHPVDTGLAAHLLGLSPAALAAPASPMREPLLETFVINELARATADQRARRDALPLARPRRAGGRHRPGGCRRSGRRHRGQSASRALPARPARQTS